MNSLARLRIVARVTLPLALAFAATTTGHMPNEMAWPTPYISADAQIGNVGDHMNINGIPVRIYRFTSTSRPEAITTYFRDHIERDFKPGRTSAALPGQTTVAGRMGDFWVTLQLQRKDGMTIGTWSAAPQFIPDSRQAVQRPPGFPASAKLIQQVDSFDDDKRSQVGIGMDPSPVDGVAQRLEAELQNQGFTRQTTPAAIWPSPNEYVAVFRKAREEILVTLQQQQQGTYLMINRISALEDFQ